MTENSIRLRAMYEADKLINKNELYKTLTRDNQIEIWDILVDGFEYRMLQNIEKHGGLTNVSE